MDSHITHHSLMKNLVGGFKYVLCSSLNLENVDPILTIIFCRWVELGTQPPTFGLFDEKCHKDLLHGKMVPSKICRSSQGGSGGTSGSSSRLRRDRRLGWFLDPGKVGGFFLEGNSFLGEEFNDHVVSNVCWVVVSYIFVFSPQNLEKFDPI